MSDQTQASPDVVESQPSEEVLALLGEDQAIDTTGQEEVTQDAEPEKTDTTKEEEANPPEEKPEDSEDKTGEEPEKTDDEPEDSKKESQEFLIAGVKYTDFSKAVEAVNRISGDNTRLAGDLNLANRQLSQKDEDIKALSQTIEEWQKFYDDGELGDRPEGPDIKQIARQIVQEERAREQEEQKKAQINQEIDELSNEKDYETVLPHMQELAQELGDSIKNISPKRLYRMARAIARGDEPNEILETAQKMADEKTKTEANKEKARKIIGGNGKKSPSIVKPDEISPEVAAIL